MQILDLKRTIRNGRARISASFIWEDCSRPPQQIYFEVPEEFESALSPDAHPFLVASIIPAFHFGERRLLVEGDICPSLHEGLITAMSWLRHWYYPPSQPLVAIEAPLRPLPLRKDRPERAGVFLSGGIDSLFTLRSNHLAYPPSHPFRIKDGIIAFGLELDDLDAFELVLNNLNPIAKNAGITLIPVWTNLYLNFRKEDATRQFDFWWHELMGAALASIGHALSGRLSMISIASDYDIPNQQPHGSHPSLDPNYGSAELRIRHNGIAFTRFEKTRLLADWNVALNGLRVCNFYQQYEKERLNCGRCEKCLRTMLSLTALHALDRTVAFPINEISTDYLQTHLKIGTKTKPLYAELITPLEQADRTDLIRIILNKMAHHERSQRIETLRSWAKRTDERFLHGLLGRLKRWIKASQKNGISEAI